MSLKFKGFSDSNFSHQQLYLFHKASAAGSRMRGVLLERGELTGAKISTRPELKTDCSARWSSKSDEQESEGPGLYALGGKPKEH